MSEQNAIELAAIWEDAAKDTPIEIAPDFVAQCILTSQELRRLDAENKQLRAQQAPVEKLSAGSNPRNFSNPSERIAYQLGFNDCAALKPAVPEGYQRAIDFDEMVSKLVIVPPLMTEQGRQLMMLQDMANSVIAAAKDGDG